jgi:chromosome segregation ATPase
MSKERISASVDPEVEAYLSRESVNASGMINKLVKQQMSSGGESKQLLQLRLEQIDSEIDRHKSQVETLKKERKGVESRIRELEENENTRLHNALEKLEKVPWEPDNPGIQDWADELDMTEQELIAELEEYHAE